MGYDQDKITIRVNSQYQKNSLKVLRGGLDEGNGDTNSRARAETVFPVYDIYSSIMCLETPKSP